MSVKIYRWKILFFLSFIFNFIWIWIFNYNQNGDYILKPIVILFIELPLICFAFWLTDSISEIKFNWWQKILFLPWWFLHLFVNITCFISLLIYMFIIPTIVFPHCLQKYVSPSGQHYIIVDYCVLTCQATVYQNRLFTMNKLGYIGVNLAGKCVDKQERTIITWNDDETVIHWQFESVSTGEKRYVTNQGILNLN